MKNRHQLRTFKILEVLPTAHTTYTMPSWVYSLVDSLLRNPLNYRQSLSGRRKGISVADAVAMLPDEFRAHVTISTKKIAR